MNKQKPIIMVKIGGSVITDKTKPMTAKLTVIKNIASDLKKIYTTYKDSYQFIIGTGAGSFGHYKVVQHKCAKHGNINSERELVAIADIHSSVAYINSVFVQACIENSLPVVAVPPLTTMMRIIPFSIQEGLIPVFHGDVIVTENSYAIYSTEQIFQILIEQYLNKKPIHAIFQLMNVHGVLDKNGKTIPHITKDNWLEYKTEINSSTNGFDVTGGIIHKVEESLHHASNNIASFLVHYSNVHLLPFCIKRRFPPENNITQVL